MNPLRSAIVVSLLAAGSTFGQAEFADPVEITAGGGSISNLLYPSPVLYDLDGDGQRELVLGDLPGHLRYATMLDNGDDTTFAALEHMKTSDKQPLKLHNW